MYTQSTLENNTPTKIRRTDSDSFGFYAATPSAPSKLQTRFMIEHLSSEPASSSAGSDLLYTNDDLTSVPNLFEDFKDVKREPFASRRVSPTRSSKSTTALS